MTDANAIGKYDHNDTSDVSGKNCNNGWHGRKPDYLKHSRDDPNHTPKKNKTNTAAFNPKTNLKGGCMSDHPRENTIHRPRNVQVESCRVELPIGSLGKLGGASRVAYKASCRKLHSRKVTWKPKKVSIKTTVLLKGDYMGFHVSLGECTHLKLGCC